MPNSATKQYPGHREIRQHPWDSCKLDPPVTLALGFVTPTSPVSSYITGNISPFQVTPPQTPSSHFPALLHFPSMRVFLHLFTYSHLTALPSPYAGASVLKRTNGLPSHFAR